MRLIVAGSRGYTNRKRVYSLLNKIHIEYPELEIVSGMAKGPDMFAHDWAIANGVDVHKFYADWDKYQKRAGFIRNEEMAHFGDACLAFWDGTSKGTKMMIKIMNESYKPISVVRD